MQTANLDDFIRILNEPAASKVTLPSRQLPTDDYAQRKARGVLYAAAVPGTNQGNRNSAGFVLAAAIREKFALMDADLLEILASWNQRNSPPLSEGELGHLVRNVEQYAKHPAGSGYAPTKSLSKPEHPQSHSDFNEFIPIDKLVLPAFPVDVLPEPLRTLSTEIAESLQVPAELPGLLGLAAISQVAAGKYEVQPKPDWIEPTNLYIAVVMPPATKKSAVFKIITEPIKLLEQQMIAARRELVERSKSDFAILEKKKLELEKKLVKGNNDDRAALNDVLREIANFKHLYEPTILASDVTPEAVSKLLYENQGRLGIFSSEGGIFSTFAGRYQDNKPVNDVFLAGHVGDPIRVNRVGRPAEYIENPCITMGLTIQPTILEHLGHKRLLEDSGMLGRFLYAMPCSGQAAQFHTPAVLESAKRSYSDVVNDLFGADFGRVLRMTLDNNAVEIFEAFYNEIHQRLFDGDLTAIASWAGKLCGHTLRIAALFELIDRAFNLSLAEDINLTTKQVTAAIALSRYLIPHAQKAFQQLGRDKTLHIAEKIVQWIVRTQSRSFTQREVYEAVKGLSVISTVSDILPPLETLIESGYLCQLPDREGVGRKSTTFQVNPECFQA